MSAWQWPECPCCGEFTFPDDSLQYDGERVPCGCACWVSLDDPGDGELVGGIQQGDGPCPACDVREQWVTDPDSEARRAARGMAFISRESEAYQYAWSKGYNEALHDNIEALEAHERAKAEPDYRAMWRELLAKVATLEEQSGHKPHLWPEQGAALDAETNAFEHVCDIMEDLTVSYRSAAEYVAWATTPDPTHTPAVRRVVAWEAVDGPLCLDIGDAYAEAADDILRRAWERDCWDSSSLDLRKKDFFDRWPPQRRHDLAAYLRHRDERAGYR